ncbi:SMI1/KNR4 family protein [Cerasicoccus maritimus]|uniref:SMI1/KNR4 family protein n=1 Tax=Cerasicoccus maritimus TaxID=490089 RepID=UPI0028528BEA|nr:SMI1/KNR4 family protein [Cerasicoccus maritimus]
MFDYTKEKQIVDEIGGSLRKLKKQELDDIKGEHQGVPEDYLDFIGEIGSGDIYDGGYKIYDGLVKPSSIYDEDTAEDLEGVLFFGDDYQGYCVGFDVNDDWKVVEYDSSLGELDVIAESFSEFIKAKLARIKSVLDG